MAGSPQLDLQTRANIRVAGKIHGEHIHRYPADRPHDAATHGDRCARGHAAEIAIGITHGNEADADAAIRDERPFIAHGFTGFEPALREDFAAQRHHGAQAGSL